MVFNHTNANTLINSARNRREGTANPTQVEEPFLSAFLQELNMVEDSQNYFIIFYEQITKPMKFTNQQAKVLWWAMYQTYKAILNKNEDLGAGGKISIENVELWLKLSKEGLKQDIFSGTGAATKAPQNITTESVIEYLHHASAKPVDRTAMEYLEWWKLCTANARFLQDLKQATVRLESDGNLLNLLSNLNTISHEVENVTRVTTTSSSINLTETSKEHVTSILKLSSSTVNFIPMADKEMNDKFYGWARGDLSLITAVPNHGKSMHCLINAYSAFAKGMRVFYLSLEMPEKKIIRELMTIANHTPKSEITNISSDAELGEYVDRFLHRVEEDGKNGGTFTYQVEKGITAKELFDIIETHLEYIGYDAVFIDLMDYIQVPHVAEANLHVPGGYYDTTIQKLLAIALKYNCAIIGVVQPSKDAILAGVLSLASIGKSFWYAQHANFIIHYARPSSDYQGISHYVATVFKDREMGQLNQSFVYSIDTDNKVRCFIPNLRDMKHLERMIEIEQKEQEKQDNRRLTLPH